MKDRRTRKSAAGAACGLAGLLLSVFCYAPGARAARFVSINMCADELLLRLADPADIASLSYLSRDARNSTIATQAAAFPVNRGRAEEVMALAPDLVFASAFSAPATLSMLRRLGVPLAVLDVPTTFEAIAAQVRGVASRIGRPEAAEREVHLMNGRLAGLRRELPLPPATALVLQANNIAVGAGTLIDSVLAEAGLVNLAAQAGIVGYGRMPLEAILIRPPDILIVDTDNEGAPALATQAPRHPALVALARRGAMRTVDMPSRLWTCAGPGTVEAVAYLRRALQGKTP
ncbi:ABC transporter substrate-binding protein [Pseudochelatococcus lubricantis]|uniref:ABC transporter substrate-binding protein n=1 Tax=Pseudochelatococcus lubricantis TaxID=1538102 RepID=UPI0035ED03E4